MVNIVHNPGNVWKDETWTISFQTPKRSGSRKFDDRRKATNFVCELFKEMRKEIDASHKLGV
jgi:hypothetical protein